MSYTNVNILDRFDSNTQLREKIFELENKINWLNRQLDSYEKELHNIPKAIKEYGYVNLTFDNETIKIGQIP
jgi:uncharacterized protein YlxW (UPF0749 family)